MSQMSDYDEEMENEMNIDMAEKFVSEKLFVPRTCGDMPQDDALPNTRITDNEMNEDIPAVLGSVFRWFNERIIDSITLHSQRKCCRYHINPTQIVIEFLRVYAICRPTNPEHTLYVNVSKCHGGRGTFVVSIVCELCGHKWKTPSGLNAAIVSGTVPNTPVQPMAICVPYVRPDILTKEHCRDSSLALHLSEMLRGTYVYCPSMKIFYVFQTNRWVADVDGHLFRATITDVLAPVCDEFVQKSLCVTIRRNNIVLECKNLLSDPSFVLDSNPLLVGFENGVYDFGIGMFRDAKVEDHISFSTRCTYLEDYLDDEYRMTRMAIDQFFESICLGRQDRVRMLKNILSSAYNGTKRQEKFLYWEGSTSPFSIISRLQKYLNFLLYAYPNLYPVCIRYTFDTRPKCIGYK